MKRHILKSIQLTALTLLMGLTTGCSDWLDVPSANTTKEEDQFDNYKGFRDALTGCYINMASTDAYGERLTMTDVENMASLWFCDDSYETQVPLKYQLTHHQYDKTEAREAIKACYAQLFTTIANANVLLKNLSEKGGNINDETTRQVLMGEAYAIRAYCQLDVLRLFGQLPEGATEQVSLPYSEVTSIDSMPAYYTFNQYVAKLESDISQAEQCLKDNDPIFSNTFDQLDNTDDAEDEFLYYRRSRLNYWAVRALHAREALYVGKTTEAHDLALEIINAKGADGNALVSLSGNTDLAQGYNGLPDECLFYLSKYDVNTYANDLLVGGRSGQATTSNYYVSSDMLTALYSSIPNCTASHNRYLNWWNRSTTNAYGNVCPTLKKYWYDESSASSSELITKYEIIPMLRLSEMYLIAMETSDDLDEVRTLYATYMKDHAFTLYTPFTSLDEARTELVNEYRREFFGEGQMFYVYKRKAATTMQFNSDEISESDYILPLPSTEYDPSTTK